MSHKNISGSIYILYRKTGDRIGEFQYFAFARNLAPSALLHNNENNVNNLLVYTIFCHVEQSML